ncbi:uncharacterized protein E0L32_007790 [Thyridium curvatum]|uniref:BZIP domain-containing protein n=1 Tax=Thyridium curvatum TaxID=1093900 RepID=A0A507B2R0_9PEZI|nr:uncharacterized protein E0L32_007790 [Thyridium curvatum]TPX11579.1 hypothetical protein E0L32_007790 [Thyridium curvatum]
MEGYTDYWSSVNDPKSMPHGEQFTPRHPPPHTAQIHLGRTTMTTAPYSTSGMMGGPAVAPFPYLHSDDSSNASMPRSYAYPDECIPGYQQRWEQSSSSSLGFDHDSQPSIAGGRCIGGPNQPYRGLTTQASGSDDDDATVYHTPPHEMFDDAMRDAQDEERAAQLQGRKQAMGQNRQRQSHVASQEGGVPSPSEHSRETSALPTSPSTTTTMSSPPPSKNPPKCTSNSVPSGPGPPSRSRGRRGRQPGAPRRTSKSSSETASADVTGEGSYATPRSPPKPTQREQNRAAATKCRAKAKAATSKLAEDERYISEERMRLTDEADQLKDEVLFLKSELLRHSHCDCVLIQEYLKRMAKIISEGSLDHSSAFPAVWADQGSVGSSCYADGAHGDVEMVNEGE